MPLTLTLKVIAEKIMLAIVHTTTYIFIFRYKSFKISLGGSGLNSSRILAGLGEVDLKFFGAIGSDTNGRLIKDMLKRSGVDAWYGKI